MSGRRVLQSGDIVSTQEDSRAWVVLEVKEEDLPNVDIDKPGLYGFGGMWHGNDPWSFNSYGKLRVLGLYVSHEIIGHVSKLSLQEIKDLTD